MTPEERAHIKAREEAATPGPWSAPQGLQSSLDDKVNRWLDGSWTPVDHEGCDVWPWFKAEDRDFAYAARTDVPALLAEVEKLVGLLDAFDRYAGSPDDTGYQGSPFQAEVQAAIARPAYGRPPIPASERLPE